MKGTIYFKQAELLLRILPVINEEHQFFAIKGGTAINFFVRNLPRLSVDIDLAYLPIKPRDESLEEITTALKRISKKVKKRFREAIIVSQKLENTSFIKRIVVNSNGITIKIEPNLVFRGFVYTPEVKQLSLKAVNPFEMSLETKTLSTAELYAGKMCAALDRQHPRDLFDIYLLFKHEGITEAVRKSFIVYLIGHSRPIVELLDPGIQDIKHIFDNEFEGMTREKITFKQLEETRLQLIETIRNNLTDSEKRFLFSMKKGEPEWGLLELPDIQNLPAVRWKLLNIRKMDGENY